MIKSFKGLLFDMLPTLVSCTWVGTIVESTSQGLTHDLKAFDQPRLHGGPISLSSVAVKMEYPMVARPDRAAIGVISMMDALIWGLGDTVLRT